MSALHTPEEAPRPRRARWPVWAASLGAWTLLECVFLAQLHFFRLSMGQNPLPSSYALQGFAGTTLWGLMTPSILLLAERFPVDRQRWRRNLGLHLLFAVGYAVVDAGYTRAIASLLELVQYPSVLERFVRWSIYNAFCYVAVSGIGHGLRSQRLLAERQRREAELEALLLQARLQALEGQLRPHFLFNALHTVSGLIRAGQSSQAVQMVAGLGDLLRTMLRHEGAQRVPLGQELAFIEKYLGIEQVRFQDRLRTRIHAPPELLDVLVPYLLLQPLVENAIRHGIEASERPGEVEVRVREEDGWLWLHVRDTGAGPGAEAPLPEPRGIGLGNTRERLRHLYGERHHLELVRAEGGGALARIGIPAQRQGAGAPAGS